MKKKIIKTKFGTEIHYYVNKSNKIKKRCIQCEKFKFIEKFGDLKGSILNKSNACFPCEQKRSELCRRSNGGNVQTPPHQISLAGKMLSRQCSKCNIMQKNIQFNKSKAGFLGHESLCKNCKSKAYKEKKKRLGILTRPRRPKIITSASGKVTHRVCNRCKEIKLLTKYSQTKSRYLGVEGICKNCKREKRLIKKYGLSLEDKRLLYEKQGNKCSSCKSRYTIHHIFIDHCHKTNKTRGLLCRSCNAALGMLGDGAPGTIRKFDRMLEYIEHSNVSFFIKNLPPTFKKKTKRLTKNDCLFSDNGTLTCKKCPKCNEKKNIIHFGAHKEGFHGRRSRCKACISKIHLEKTYDINYSVKKALFKKQNGCCEICSKRKAIEDLCVDHDHRKKFNNIRGLLCNNCNTALGFLGDGNRKTIQAIQNLILYIVR